MTEAFPLRTKAGVAFEVAKLVELLALSFLVFFSSKLVAFELVSHFTKGVAVRTRIALVGFLSLCLFGMQDYFGQNLPTSSQLGIESLSGSGLIVCASGKVPCDTCFPPTDCVVSWWGTCRGPGLFGGHNGTDGCLGNHPPCCYYDGCSVPCSCGFLNEANCGGAPINGVCSGFCTANGGFPCNCEC